MDFNSFNRILIIRLSSLGDILLTTPLVRSLKKEFPRLKIDFLLSEEYKDIYVNNPYIDKLFLFKKKHEGVPDNLTAINYDLTIDLQNNFRSAGIRKKLKSGTVRIFNKRTLDKLLLVSFKINRLKNAERIPVRYSNTLDNFHLDDEGPDLFTEDVKPLIDGRDGKYIGFAPGSRHFTKRWPADYYTELGEKLIREDFTIVLFGGKDDRIICKEISENIPQAIDLSNNNNLLLTAVNMKECKVVACNDSGLMHLACAVRVPVFVFFGSTVKEFGFTPYRNKNLILENNDLTCRPCSHIGKDSCPKKHFKCMLKLNPDLAFNKLIQLINF